MMPSEPKSPKRHAGSILAVGLLVVAFAGLLEGASYLVVHYQERFRDVVAPPILNDYHYKLPGESIWRLKPNYSRTLAETIEMKRQTDRDLGAEYLAQRGAKLGYHSSDVTFRIDSDGYKGPELVQDHALPRILTLGDSCTFGTLFDKYSYPRSMERAFNASNQQVEVVNGGVEAYAPHNVLTRIEEFKKLRPEITTIYIGWNALFSSAAVSLRYKPNTLIILEKAYSRLAPKSYAMAAYTRPKKPDLEDSDLKRLDTYIPYFTPAVEKIAREMRSAGSRVVIVTLPGIYDLNEVPTPAAMKVGYLPTFTDNPYVLAKIAARYNDFLRSLALREDFNLIDLDRWAKTELQPRDAYFSDSVHLYEEGQQKIGEYMASQLLGIVEDIRNKHLKASEH
jgi:lysophospholipase L1-like esterase